MQESDIFMILPSKNVMCEKIRWPYEINTELGKEYKV